VRIFEAEYGSRAHGTHTEFSDHDRMAIEVEGPEYITGLETWDVKHQSTAPDGQRSTVDDTDTTIYGLKKWASLAAAGNPTVLTALFVPNEIDSDRSAPWGRIQYNRKAFLSKSAGKKFLGYMNSQVLALEGKRNKKTNRPELELIHGFDTKFGYHAMRLALQGIELMQTGKLELPMDPIMAGFLTDIREGRHDKQSFLSMIDRTSRDLERAIENSRLPEHPDRGKINNVLHETYLEVWNDRR